jgi:hypothetical protein
MKMSDWMKGYQYESYMMGGTAYSDYRGIDHPIFQGLRINLETHEPVNQNIQVFRRTVNRKRAKDLMLAYREAFKSPDAFLKCMDTETMVVSIKDILEENMPSTNADGARNYYSQPEYFKKAEELFNDKNNFDAVIMYGFAMRINGFNDYAISNYASGNRHYYRFVEPKNVVSTLTTALSKRLYMEHKPFDEEEVDFNKTKGSRWGLRVVVDGVDVRS